MRRCFDWVVSCVALVLLSPLVLFLCGVVWLSDGYTPFFRSQRVGQRGRLFEILKIRTMVWNADQRLSITSQGDSRITPLGRFIRTWKLDELPQLWNVLKGDMSLVGPRPDVYEGGVSLYSPEEREIILSVRPGMVDFASIVFAEEGKILGRFKNPKEGYEREILPLKKHLMIFYVQHQSLGLNFLILCTTVLLLFSRAGAFDLVMKALRYFEAPSSLVVAVGRVTHRA